MDSSCPGKVHHVDYLIRERFDREEGTIYHVNSLPYRYRYVEFSTLDLRTYLMILKEVSKVVNEYKTPREDL